jgi:transketolase
MEQIATRDVYGKTLVELGKKYNDIVVLDADLSASTKTILFAKEFPERFFNMGVAEQNLIGFAAGLANGGKVAFASTFAMFATGRGWEQIRNTVCYNNLNVKIACSHAGITVGEDGSSHQSLEDIALMSIIPNMTVVVPCDGPETKKAVTAAYHHKGPVYLRLSRPKFPVITKEDSLFTIGKASVINEGNDLTIIACGLMVGKAVEAISILKQKNINARLINMHTIKPIDKDIIIKAAKETGVIVTAEEHSIIGGLGSAVASVASMHSPVPIEMVGTKDTFGQSGQPDELCKKYNLDTPDIVKAAEKAISRKSKNV